MTRAQQAAEDAIDRLFDEIEVLAGLRGYSRDRAKEDARRLLVAAIEPVVYCEGDELGWAALDNAENGPAPAP